MAYVQVGVDETLAAMLSKHDIGNVWMAIRNAVKVGTARALDIDPLQTVVDFYQLNDWSENRIVFQCEASRLRNTIDQEKNWLKNIMDALHEEMRQFPTLAELLSNIEGYFKINIGDGVFHQGVVI